jgi:hypothetical protein
VWQCNQEEGPQRTLFTLFRLLHSLRRYLRAGRPRWPKTSVTFFLLGPRPQAGTSALFLPKEFQKRWGETGGTPGVKE